jgi:outer membrane murein-binding lipoprotein Lpp
MSAGELAAILGPFAAIVIAFIGFAIASSNRGHDHLRADLHDLAVKIDAVAVKVDAIAARLDQMENRGRRGIGRRP